jgi:hypothetical protein
MKAGRAFQITAMDPHKQHNSKKQPIPSDQMTFSILLPISQPTLRAAFRMKGSMIFIACFSFMSDLPK